MVIAQAIGVLFGVLAHAVPGTGFGSAVAVVGSAGIARPWAVAVGAPGRLDMPGTVWLLPSEGGRPIWRSEGLVAGSRFGFALAAAGDLDGDGVSDLLVGAPEESGRGAVHVISGRTGGKLLSVHGRAGGDRLGHSLAWVGRRAAMDRALWVVGAPQATGSRHELASSQGAGYVRLYEGLVTTVVKEWSGNGPGCGFGSAIEVGITKKLGPLLAVGAPFFTEDAADRVGSVHYYSLSDDVFEQRVLGGSPGMQFGQTLEFLGGRDGSSSHLLVASSHKRLGDARPSTVSLMELDTMEILWTTASERMEGALGHSVATLTSMGSSGLDVRLFVSAPLGGPTFCGGFPTPAGALIELDVQSGTRKSELRPIDALCQHHVGGTYGHGPFLFAFSLDRGCDFDGDSQEDLLIGSPDNFGSGEVWVYSPTRNRILMRWTEWEVLGQECNAPR